MRRLHHITRLDYGRTHAWWVRFQRTVGGKRKVIGTMFSDGKFGGRSKALECAIRWRDKNIDSHPPGRPQGGGRRHAPIGHAIIWIHQSGRRYDVNAYIKVSTEERLKQFRASILKYGKRRAWDMAVSWVLAERKRLLKKGVLADERTLREYGIRLRRVRAKARAIRG